MSSSPHTFPRRALTWASFLGALVIARASLADHYQVPSGSMEPTVAVGDHVLVNKAAYGLRVPFTEHYLGGARVPTRGDVVVLDSPESGIVLLKRVVAVEGDRVEVRDGRVALNGQEVPMAPAPGADAPVLERLDRGPHPVALSAGGGPDLGPVVVPPGKLLVLGDNRGMSHDGRSFGWVSKEAVLGRALVTVNHDGMRGL